MKNILGTNLTLTLYGESHGAAVGAVLDGLAPGIPVDEDYIRAQLDLRRPVGDISTPRQEPDKFVIDSGLYEGKTTGTPLCIRIPNENVRSESYSAMRAMARPGHADYTGYVKYAGCNDPRGGGHTSGRLTAPLTVAGALAITYLKTAHIAVHADVLDEEALRARAAAAKADGDSVGGVIRCTVSGLPAGLGGPDWRDTVEGTIARHVFAIPAVKAIGFGAGETFAQMRGSAANDPFTMARGAVRTVSNHSGGVNAGITNGMDVVFDVTFRPTPSIAKEQRTVDLYTMTETTISVSGRHDACIALRAAPAVESAAALAVRQLLPDTPADLDGLRCRLDETDAAILELFDCRQRLSAAIGAYKSAHGLPVRDKAREEEVLRTRGDMLPERRDQAERLMTLLMALSREEQA